MTSRVARAGLAGLALAVGMLVAGCGASGKASAAKPAPVRTSAPSPAVTSRPASETPTASPTPSPTPSPSPDFRALFKPPAQLPLRVELWGDSISAQAAPDITFALDATGKAITTTHTYPGTAMCDWFSDMSSEINPANPSGFHPQVAIIQFSGDAFTPCMKNASGVAYSGQALVNKYASDSATAIALFSKAGVPVFFVSTPISRGQAAQGAVGNTPFGFMFAKLPARFPAGHLVQFIDAAQAVEWHGHYSDTLPCEAGEACTGTWPDGTKTVVVREADGTHFCPVKEVPLDGGPSTTCPVPMPGAQRYARAIATPILQAFSLT
jgi:hypothetical protein